MAVCYRSFATSLVLILAGCAAQPTAQGLRNAATPMASMVVLDTNRIKGLWHEVAGYPLRPGCRPGTVGLTIEITGSDCYLPVPSRGATLSVTGPGRLTISGGPELWVLWVDGDYRTLVIGDPQGRFAAILNREVTISPDRLVAAKKILAFNGYDVSRLQGG
jgi:apolipoprotein D and lipocalin family protein